MHRLHVALVDLDVHRIGNRDAQFLADGRLGVSEKLLPEIRIQGGLLNNLLQHLIAASHGNSPSVVCDELVTDNVKVFTG